jgi:Asp-tRNA(Asn)/Glu-tRNA(Gln) amidotransferase A subunit family amidase
VDSALARIAAVNPKINAFCFVYADEAMALAREAERRAMAGGDVPPLLGVPIAIKDFTPLKGKRTTLGSKAFEHWVPDWQPVIVDRLQAAGAIIVGKTTTPEFAGSGFTHSKLWGVTRNPWNLERTPSGSSGGSGAAVAAGCVPLAEGTDFGGSVRGPASACGIVGMKPSLGRVPFDLLPTVYDSRTHFGPLARTVGDAALFLNVAKGPHDRDPQSLPPIPDVTLKGDLRGRRIALSVDLGFHYVDPEIAANLRAAADALRGGGAVVEEVALGWTAALYQAWNDLENPLVAALYGHLLPQWRDALEPSTVAAIELGRTITAEQVRRGELVRTEAWRALAHVHERYDALICPTEALPPPPATATDAEFYYDRPDGKYYGVAMTMAFSLLSACPVISVPTGFTRESLPTGMQIVGRRHDDAGVLDIAFGYERARPWADQRPPL